MANPQHFTLVANTAKTFTLDADFNSVEVTNVSGTAAVYFAIGSDAAIGVQADGCEVIPAAIGSLTVKVRTSGNTVVKVISAGTPQVSVKGVL